MGGGSSESASSVYTNTQSYADSFNRTETINRVFDNVGNTSVYIQSPPDTGEGFDFKSLLLPMAAIALIIVGVFYTMKN